MLYPQNGGRIVTIDTVTSLHPMWRNHVWKEGTSSGVDADPLPFLPLFLFVSLGPYCSTHVSPIPFLPSPRKFSYRSGESTVRLSQCTAKNDTKVGGDQIHLVPMISKAGRVVVLIVPMDIWLLRYASAAGRPTATDRHVNCNIAFAYRGRASGGLAE